MAVWDTKILWGFMFLLTGAVGQRVFNPFPAVKYPPPVCAVRGSTVTLPCSFTPARSVTEGGREVQIEIIRVRWCQNHEICQKTTPSVYDSSSMTNDPRYKYLGDKTGNCTLQITNIQKEDNATFRFRMEANDGRADFTEQLGVRVTVTEIQMKINRSRGDEVLKGGETVTLYCTVLFPPRTSAECSTFHHPEVTWFRDGNTLSQSGPALQLHQLTAKDSGNYTCALKANVHTLSTPFILHVEAGEEETTTKSGAAGTSVSPDATQGGDGKLPLIVGVVFGALLVLFVIVLVLCIIRRKRAADKHQTAVGAKLEQKRLDDLDSTVLPPSERQGGHHHQETDRAVEEVSYASVQFKHKNQARLMEKDEDTVIYSSVASKS